MENANKNKLEQEAKNKMKELKQKMKEEWKRVKGKKKKEKEERNRREREKRGRHMTNPNPNLPYWHRWQEEAVVTKRASQSEEHPHTERQLLRPGRSDVQRHIDTGVCGTPRGQRMMPQLQETGLREMADGKKKQR
mgnify:CR=1 FL=1